MRELAQRKHGMVQMSLLRALVSRPSTCKIEALVFAEWDALI